MTLRLPYCIIISLILVVGLLGNLFAWRTPLLGLTFGLAYLAFFGLILGFVLFRNHPIIFKFLYGLLFLLSGISFFGAIIYYFYQLNNLAVAALIIAVPVFLLPFLRYGNHLQSGQGFNPVQVNPHLLRTTFLLAAFIFLTILNFRFLLNAGTEEAIRSPWKVLPFQFFLTYFGASTILLFFLLKSQKDGLNLILTSIHAFLTVSLVLFVYKIGYGFDPFIHQATEKVILNRGFILPKPPYYLGQYSIVVFLSKILQTPIEWIDKLLLPLLISLILPATVFFTLRPLVSQEKKYQVSAGLPALLIFALPFSAFINTTPQGLADFYLLIIVFLSILSLRREFPLSCLYFLCFTTLFIHPLAGLPCLIFISLLTLFAILKKPTPLEKKSLTGQGRFFEFLRQIVFIGGFILASVAIPLFFIAASLFLEGPNGAVSLKFLEGSNNLFANFDWRLPTLVNHFRPLYDLAYTYGKNIAFILLAVGLTGFFLLKKQLPTSLVYLAAFFALIINYILIKFFIIFPLLIGYEQNVYPQRILEIGFYFLTPLFLFALYKFFEKLQESSRFLKFFFVLFFGLILTFSLYYSYPKDDGEDYEIDRGYSTSIHDIKAVRTIDLDAESQNYIVLANQMVSAAAVREFGFKKYYGQNFYYPIPTGYPLYKYYLKMVYETPSRATVSEAANLTGVRLVYFVLNNYWTDAEKIIEAAKPTADDFINIDGGEILIFKYEL